jgi:hypothetical protein
MLGPQGELGRITDTQTFVPDADLSRSFGNYAAGYLRAYTANPDDHRFRIGVIYQSQNAKQWGTETFIYSDAVVRTLYPVSGAGQHALTVFQQKKQENSVHYGTGTLLEYVLKDTPNVPIFIPILFDRGTRLADYRESLRDIVAKEQLETPVIEVLNLVGPVSAARQNIEAFMALKELLLTTLVKKDMRKSLEARLVEGMRTEGHSAPSPAIAPSFAQTSTFAPKPATPATPAARITTPTLNSDTGSKQWYATELDDPTCRKLESYLRQPREYADPDNLRQFIRMRELTIDQQKELAASCPLYAAPQGTTLLEQGTKDQWNLYLLNGQVQLVAGDGEKKIISAETPNASSAIASLKPRKFTVTATTSVRFLLIHENIITEVKQRKPGSSFSLV